MNFSSFANSDLRMPYAVSSVAIASSFTRYRNFFLLQLKPLHAHAFCLFGAQLFARPTRAIQKPVYQFRPDREQIAPASSRIGAGHCASAAMLTQPPMLASRSSIKALVSFNAGLYFYSSILFDPATTS